MGNKKRDAGTIGTAGRESEMSATYFPFLGPSSMDTHDTSFCGPGAPAFHQQASSSGIGTGYRMSYNRRDTESLNSSPSETAEDNIISIPMRPRLLRDAQSLVLVAPPFSPLCPPGFAPIAPPIGPSLVTRSPRSDSYELIVQRKTSPYQHMQHLGLRHLVIFMAGLFVLAFVAAIFTAVYFGHKLEPNSRA